MPGPRGEIEVSGGRRGTANRPDRTARGPNRIGTEDRSAQVQQPRLNDWSRGRARGAANGGWCSRQDQSLERQYLQAKMLGTTCVLTDGAQLRAAGDGGPPQFNDTVGASYVPPEVALRSRLGPASRRAARLLKRVVRQRARGAETGSVGWAVIYVLESGSLAAPVSRARRIGYRRRTICGAPARQ